MMREVFRFVLRLNFGYLKVVRPAVVADLYTVGFSENLVLVAEF